MEQIKVALLCSFSDVNLRSHMTLKQNRKLFKSLIKLFGLPSRVGEYSDYAPWVPNLIVELEEYEAIELHVIAEHKGLKKGIEEFKIGRTYYHIYSSEFSSFARITDNLKIWMKLEKNHRYVSAFLNKIRPDIVNVVGIENPCNAVPAYYIDDYPVFVLSQTIYSNPARLKYSKGLKKINWDLEVLLHKKLKYFAVYSPNHYNVLKEHNPKAIIFDYDFPTQRPPIVNKETKIYDFVNFALSLDNRKGVDDSIKAIAKLKHEYPNVRLNLVGRCDSQDYYNKMIEDLGVEDNVFFTPFFERQEDLFQHLQKSKFAVLPCKLDATSQTMLQALYYQLPLVVYKTAGTPSFNLKKDCALIAEMEDVDDLVLQMKRLLSDPTLVDNLKKNGYEYMENIFHENKKLIKRIVDDYYAIIDNYKSQIDIPDNLLFKVN